jgi:hypothetical protein
VKLRAVKEWLRANLTTPISEVWRALNRKLTGHYQYYGVSDNWPWLLKFREAVKRLLFRWINRRSQRRSMTLRQFGVYVDRHGLASPRRLVNLNSAFV